MSGNIPARLRAARQDESGFTLVELLVVIAILGVLAGVAVFSVRGITDRGDKSACQSEVSTVKTALESAKAQDNTYYPQTATKAAGDLVTLGFLSSVPKYLTVTVTGTGAAATYTLVASTTTATPAGCTIA